MPLLPNRMDTGNRREVPMFRVHRCKIPQPGDFFTAPPFRFFHGPPTQLFLNDLKDSRFYPDLTTMRVESSRLKLKISMYGYKPEDIKLEVVDKFLVIQAKHEERKEKNCFVSREFKRRLYLPEYVIADDVDAKWSPYGWLSVYIPLKVHFPNSYPTTGGQRPIKSGDKPIEPKKVRPVAIKIAKH